MAFHKAETYGESMSILDSAVGLVTKTHRATPDMAGEDGVIKAGTLVPGEDVYTKVETPGSDNPQTKGWYELEGDDYVASTDTSPQEGTTYYTKSTTGPVGIVFEDYDMTDYAEGYPVSVVVQGRVKADKVSAEAKAQAETFAKQGLYLV